MYYSCPKCSSKKTETYKLFSPITAKRLECGYINIEKKIINEEERSSNTLLNYSH